MRLNRRSGAGWAGIATGIVAAAAVLALAADTIAASFAERALADEAGADPRLPSHPNAYVSGFPFSLAALSGTVPRVEVSALDVQVADVGVVNVRSEASDVKVDPSDAFAGNFVGAQASSVRRTVRLDGVAFGELLGMTDLDIANPTDISPGGGTSSEAQLTGTVPGTDSPSTVLVTLRLDGPMFRMRPVFIDKASSGDNDAIKRAYTLDMDTRDLPLGGPADLVQLSGGSIEFAHERINTTVTSSDLAPLPPDHTDDR